MKPSLRAALPGGMTPELAAAFATLARFLAPMLAPLVAPLIRAEVDPDPMVPLFGAIPGAKPRTVAELGRRGAIDGACKIGRTWSARRSAIDAYLEAQRPPEPANDAGDELDLELTRAGWR